MPEPYGERCEFGCLRHASVWYTKRMMSWHLCNVCSDKHADALDAQGWRVLVPA
jgi:hypothetical protein